MQLMHTHSGGHHAVTRCFHTRATARVKRPHLYLRASTRLAERQCCVAEATQCVHGYCRQRNVGEQVVLVFFEREAPAFIDDACRGAIDGDCRNRDWALTLIMIDEFHAADFKARCVCHRRSCQAPGEPFNCRQCNAAFGAGFAGALNGDAGNRARCHPSHVRGSSLVCDRTGAGDEAPARGRSQFPHQVQFFRSRACIQLVHTHSGGHNGLTHYSHARRSARVRSGSASSPPGKAEAT